jgi:AcrR family transcriptional regulator
METPIRVTISTEPRGEPVNKDPSDHESAEGRAQPQQSRSQETWNAILEAGAALFDERGYDETTSHQIAAKAGVSVGALYRYFDGKEAVLKELYRRESSAQRERALAEFSIADLVGKDLPSLLRKTLTVAFRVYRERPGLQRVFAEQSRKIPDLAEVRRGLEGDLREAVRQIFAAAPGVRVPDIEVGAYLATVFIQALMEDFILHQREPREYEDERVIEAATDFVMRYALGRIE